MQFEQLGSSQQASGSYSEPFSRKKRGFLIFLLDQSGSMREELIWKGYKLTLAQMATTIMNNLLVTVIDNAKVDSQTGLRKDYCDILIYGYGNEVGPLLNRTGTPVSVPMLADKPVGRHKVRVTMYDPMKGQDVSVEQEQPFWITPHGQSEYTEMAAAIRAACQAVESWLKADPRRRFSFPPIVINITDGRHNGRSNDNPVHEAMKLQNLRTDDGAVLLFNCHLTTAANTQKLSFPSSVEEIQRMNLSDGDRLGARQLFEMSSIVPRTMTLRAQHVFGRNLPSGARGFMYNASPQDLLTFLSWGTRQSSEFVK
jgi:uncharacterized protein YegL